jgi:hypothetical protein
MKHTLLPLALLTIAAIASAQNKLETVISIGEGGGYYSKTSSTANTLTDNKTVIRSGVYSASSKASYGVLKTFASAVAGPYPDDPYEYFGDFATGIARFTDHLTINAADPALQGTSGILTVQYRIDGSLSAAGGTPYSNDTNNYFAAWSVASSTLSFNGNPWQQFSETLRPNGQRDGDDFLGKTQTASVGFTFGEGFDFGLSITSSGVVCWNTAQTATSDMAHSAYWGGFTSVTDTAGDAVGYSVSSSSGHDWSQASTQAVPEPTSIAALGLGALGVLKRRRRA